MIYNSQQREYKDAVNLSKNSPLPIKPPASKKETSLHNGSPPYRLFESTSPSQYWLSSKVNQDIPIARKHSVSVDGSDSLFSPMKYENNHAGFWRRASLPNNSFFMMSSYPCSVCTLPFCFNDDFLQTNCNHSVCKRCTGLNALSCPLCLTNNENAVEIPSSFITEQIIYPSTSQRNQVGTFNSFGVLNRDSSSPSNISPSLDLIYLEEKDENFYIGDLLSSKSLDSHLTTAQAQYSLCCVKLTNIPFDISQKDVISFFGEQIELPCSSTHAQSIHIMMDRATGKTQSHCYVEFSSMQQALRAIDCGNKRAIKGRIINVTLCPMDELLSFIFPSWKGGFTESKANQVSDQDSPNDCFVTRDEIKSLLIICKNYKLHFSRKCAERPFENIISIITKYPWEQHGSISESQKEDVFTLLKLSIEALKVHLVKESIQIDRSLLDRMINAGVLCPGFTDSQKSILLQTADNVICPADVKSLAVWNSQEQSKQGNLQSRKQQNTIDKSGTCLDDSYVHIVPNIAINQSKIASSLLNILNQPEPKIDGPKKDVFTKNVLSSLLVPHKANVGFKDYGHLYHDSGSISPSSGSDNDDDSYCFCEKEEENDEEFLIF